MERLALDDLASGNAEKVAQMPSVRERTAGGEASAKIGVDLESRERHERQLILLNDWLWIIWPEEMPRKKWAKRMGKERREKVEMARERQNDCGLREKGCA
jgi:hypothetical protein